MTGTFRGALALLVALALPAGAQEIRVVDVHTVPLDERAATGAHRLTLTLYGFRGTRWEPGAVVQAARAAARLLAQCGIALGHAELRILEAPRRFHYYFTPTSRELLRAVEVPKPAVFFVDDTQNRPAFDAEAIGRANSTTRPELADTVWVAYGARDLPLVLAHELVHLLSDSGDHTDAPGNLMREETSAHNNQLTSQQCALLRSRGVANGLLKPTFAAQ